MNIDFLVIWDGICQWLANHLTGDQKIVIHSNSCIILYILHASLQELWLNIRQRVNPQKTPQTSPKRVRFGVSFVDIFLENWQRFNGTALYLSIVGLFGRPDDASRRFMNMLGNQNKVGTTGKWLLVGQYYLSSFKISIQSFIET